MRKLCRLLGFGLLSVLSAGKVEVLVEPVPWRPRRDAKRRSRIVEEHRRRQGDPTMGGSTRQPINRFAKLHRDDGAESKAKVLEDLSVFGSVGRQFMDHQRKGLSGTGL